LLGILACLPCKGVTRGRMGGSGGEDVQARGRVTMTR